MSRHALNGISRVIKANTTEKSIDDLRAEGKKRVRVVSSDRVMAIIQAIVDDTINSEVGEITRRDRDRIVSDTQDRFSRVLKMQQDLEQDVEDLRGSLRQAELERDRVRGEKTLLEAQLEAARRTGGDEDTSARLAREMSRLRDTVERTNRESGGVDEAALGAVVEKLTARETQNTRRLAADLEDIRSRLDAVGRDAAAARDASAEKLVQRLNVRLCESDAHLEERLERGFSDVTKQVAVLRSQAGRAPAAADDAVARLRSEFDALESRMHGTAKSSSDEAERVAKSVIDWLQQRDAAEAARRKAEAAGEAAQAAESLRRAQRETEEMRESILRELAHVRDAAVEASSRPVSLEAAQVGDLEERFAASAAEANGSLARAVDRVAERTASLDASLQALRGEIAATAGRAPAAEASASQIEAAARLDGALGDLRAEFSSLTARAAEAAERQEKAIRALSEHVAQSAAAQSGSMETNFKGALEQALDKITRTMERATAKPIEMTGEATDVLLAKLFDVPDGEMTSNLDQLDVDQRHSKSTIAKSVGRLKEMNGRAKPVKK